MMDTSLRDKARILRSNGSTLDEITKLLDVPRGTVYGWIRDVVMDSRAKNRLIVARENHLKSIRHLAVAAKRNISNDAITDSKIFAEHNLMGIDSSSDILALSLLYWAEGSKHLGNGMQFINSDPLMIRLYLHLLRKAELVDEQKLKVMLHLHSYHDINQEIDYWSKVCNVPKEQFYTPHIKNNSGVRKKLDYHGCVSIRYYSKPLAQKLTMLYTLYAENALGV